MQKRVVMCDIDGVLADFILGFTSEAAILYGTPFTNTREQESWNTFKGLSPEQVAQVWAIITHSTHFWSDLYPLLSYAERCALKRLMIDHTVYFVTNRPGTNVVRQTRRWLDHCLGVENPNIIVSKRKGEVASAIDANYCLDDKAANASCVDWLTDGRCQSFLLNRPYNQCPSDFLASGVKRVSTVLEFIQHIEKEHTQHE